MPKAPVTSADREPASECSVLPLKTQRFKPHPGFHGLMGGRLRPPCFGPVDRRLRGDDEHTGRTLTRTCPGERDAETIAAQCDQGMTSSTPDSAPG